MKRRADPSVALIGNERYMGYSKDLIDLIANNVGFNYELRLVKDSKYGGLDPKTPSGWNGMVGAILTNETDIAIGPLTITAARQRVIQFTQPFMKTGISIKVKKPVQIAPGMFSFLTPFSREVWALVIASYIGILIVWFIATRLTGRRLSARMVWCVCGVFTIIVLTTYTATLGPYLHIQSMIIPVSSADDLAKQSDIQYGVLRYSSTSEFFRKSKISVYSRMWEYMSANPEVFVDSYKEGVRRVRESKGKYAFLIESHYNNYKNQHMPCDTIKVGHNLDDKGFGVATALNSKLGAEINLAVLSLKESGDLTKLENKWWFDRSECRSFLNKWPIYRGLTLSPIAGCFYLVVGGLILALIVALIEFCWIRKSQTKTTQKNGVQFVDRTDP